MLLFPVALAFADEAGQASGGGGALGGFMSFAPLVILFVIFYFLLIRPQQKKMKEHKKMLSEVQKGDSIITTSGIYGKVTAVSEDSLTVEIADNVRIKIQKEAISARKPQA